MINNPHERPEIHGTLRWLEDRPAPRLALLLCCGLLGACASGGPATSDTGPRTGTLTIAGPRASGSVDRASVEVTNEPSVYDSTVRGGIGPVWSVLPSVFETLRIETPTVSPGSLEIGNPGYRAGRIEGRRLSTYLDCGNTFGGARADRYDVTLYVMVRLGGAPEGGTRVRTVVDAYAAPRDVSGNAVHCTSKRTLEQRIVELIEEGLSA